MNKVDLQGLLGGPGGLEYKAVLLFQCWFRQAYRKVKPDQSWVGVWLLLWLPVVGICVGLSTDPLPTLVVMVLAVEVVASWDINLPRISQVP